MALDPNFILQLVLSKRAERDRIARQDQLSQQRAQQRVGEQSFNLLVEASQNADINPQDIAGVLPAVTQPQIKFAEALNKAAKQRKKREEAISQIPGLANQVQAAGGQRGGVANASLQSTFGSVAPTDRPLLSNLLAGELAGRQVERRQAVSDSTRESLSDSYAGLLFYDPSLQPVIQQLIQQQFPDAANQVYRDVLARASAAGEQGVGQTQVERFISQIPDPNARQQARQRYLQQLTSPTQTVRQRTPLSDDRLLEIAQQDDRTVAALDNGLRIVSIIEEDPSAVGFGARVRGAVQAVGEVARGVDSVLGTGTFDSFQNYALNSLPEEDNPAVNKLAGILTNPNAAEVDFGQLMLAFVLEQQSTGGRRFSIEAVQRILNRLEGGPTRPPAITRKVLLNALKRLRTQVTRNRRLLRAVDPEAGRRFENVLGPIPEINAKPGYIFSPDTGLNPAGANGG